MEPNLWRNVACATLAPSERTHAFVHTEPSLPRRSEAVIEIIAGTTNEISNATPSPWITHNASHLPESQIPRLGVQLVVVRLIAVCIRGVQSSLHVLTHSSQRVRVHVHAYQRG